MQLCYFHKRANDEYKISQSSHLLLTYKTPV